MAKVSILIPVYNTSLYLNQCLDSIINQTYKDLQIVLIDDGSKDNSLAVCNEYASKDNRIEVFNQENQGVAITRNHLLEKIKGDYFLFIDSDDWIEPSMVEFMITEAEEKTADVVMCGKVENKAPVNNNFTYKIYDNATIIREFLYHNELRGSLWNKLLKSNLLTNLSFHCEISYGEDALFCWQYFHKVKKAVITDKCLYHYRLHETSISNSSFGPKKLSGHKVWDLICDDVKNKYPQFNCIAQARFCIESTLLLRDAAHCRYKNKEDIQMLQQTIKKYWNCLNRVKITTVKIKFYSYIACRSYYLARLI